MKQVEDSIEKHDELLNHQWINLVGDAEGFEGDTVEDKRILISLMGKTSFAWEEEDELIREADKQGYGVSLIIFDRTEQKESYLRGTRTKDRKNRNFKLRRKAA